jgi:hypothetical protein
MTDLGDLFGGTGVSSASGVNCSGQVVGASFTDVAATFGNGFLYTGGRMQPLVPGDYSAVGSAISNAGQIVGTDDLGGAFLYSSGTLAYLDNLVDPSLELHFEYAYAINDAGQILVSGGPPYSPTVDYLLTPTPEPATLSLLALGGLALLRRARY